MLNCSLTAGDSILVTWMLSPIEAIEPEQLVKDVATHDRAGHELFEESGDVQVIAAKDEYSAELFGH